MENNEMNLDEWRKCLEEYFEGEDWDSWEESEENVSGNPYGAGRYGFIRSAENCEFLIRGKKAEFRPESNRWFEHISCGYACWRDGDAELEYDAAAREDLYKKYPQMSYKEVFYNFEYGETRDCVACASFWMEEVEKAMYREFHFDLEDITVQQLEECFAAIENWHDTDEFQLWHFALHPCTGPWRKL